MAKITIYCTEEQKRAVKAAAAKAGESMSDYYLPDIVSKANNCLSGGDDYGGCDTCLHRKEKFTGSCILTDGKCMYERDPIAPVEVM